MHRADFAAVPHDELTAVASGLCAILPVLTVHPETSAKRLRAALSGPTPVTQGRTSLVLPIARAHAGQADDMGGAAR